MSSAENAVLFETLAARVGGYPRNNGKEIYTACPGCGKDHGRARPSHFSFSEKGGHCFVCGYSASLHTLAEHYGGVSPATAAPPQAQPVEPKVPRQWQHDPEAYVSRFAGALDTVQLWQAYRAGLGLETIARYRLGVGVLPSSQCRHKRLIYHVRVNGKVVAFRGRAISCDCPKWLTAGGSETVLFGLDLATAGSTVIVCENPVDCMLAMQMEPGAVVVAGTAGAGTWRAEWTAELAHRKPKHILIWLDHDIAGNCAPSHCAACRAAFAAWKAKHPQTTRFSQPSAPRIANQLIAAGLRTSIYGWPDDAPAKADLGWYLTEGGAA